MRPQQPTSTLQLPHAVHTRELRHLAQIGHKNGLLQRLQLLEDSQQANAEFIAVVRQLSTQFQFAKIIALLTDNLPEPHSVTEPAIEKTL